jgi:GNAT superfamily N-acetyltransferase
VSLAVRAGTVEDAAALAAIRLEALADTPEAFGATYEEVSAWSEAQWREVAGSWNFFLGEREGRVAGMASGGTPADQPGTHWLFGMYVTPASRGTGLAAALVEAVEGWARAQGADRLYLRVAVGVARARAFYVKLGFTETGETLTLGRDPAVVLLTMVKPLG